MSKKTLLPRTDDDEINFIIDDINKDTMGHAQPKKSKVLTQKSKTVKVSNINKEQYKKAKSAHKVEIAKLKAQRAKLKGDIKRHKMLIKQAKLVYKISKMKAEVK